MRFTHENGKNLANGSFDLIGRIYALSGNHDEQVVIIHFGKQCPN